MGAWFGVWVGARSVMGGCVRGTGCTGGCADACGAAHPPTQPHICGRAAHASINLIYTSQLRIRVRVRCCVPIVCTSRKSANLEFAYAYGYAMPMLC